MILRRAICAVGMAALTVSAHAEQDIRSRAKTFCNDGVKLTELSIKFDVEKLVSLDAGRKSNATLDSLSVVEIAMMRLNCNMLVAELITPEQFLTKQTEILQFALGVENTRKIGESKVNPAAKSDSTTTATGNTAPAVKDSKKTTTDTKKQTATKPAKLSIKTIAKDLLDVILTDKTAVGQTGNNDLVESSIQRIITAYSPIPLNK